MDPLAVDGSGADSGDSPVEGQDEAGFPSPTPTPPLSVVDATALQMPPAGGGARLAFYLGAPTGAKSRGAREGLPPTGTGQKRARTPVASSSEGDRPVQKKSKNRATGDKQKAKFRLFR